MPKSTIYLLAFLEGLSVIFIEIMGGKLLVPYFGNSLVIWASTIGVTMSSLAIGYFLGGFLSANKHKSVILLIAISLASLGISLMPAITSDIISYVQDFGLHKGSVAASILLLGFPLVFLGCVPPILVQIIGENEKIAGKESGFVFSFSTIGSIIGALLIGFFLIESFGVKLPLIAFSVLLVAFSWIILHNAFKSHIYIALVLLPVLLSFFKTYKGLSLENVIYHSESLQGQIMIKDFIQPSNEDFFVRKLFLNGIPQTSINFYPENPTLNKSNWYYVHLDGLFASSKPAGSDALLLGFGGGSIAQELVKMRFNLDVVEIDKRLPEIAYNYFYFDTTQVNFFIKDARYFLKSTPSNKKYDLAVLDLLHGEVQPNHVLTTEGMTQLKSLLHDDAIVIINYQSNFDEPKKPFLAIYKTLIDSGYDAIFVSALKEKPTDFVFIASPSALPDNIFDENHINDCCYNNPIAKSFRSKPNFVNSFRAPKQIIDSLLKNVPTLLDDKPILEIMNYESILAWRTRLIQENQLND